jgi:Tfp pilus assembly protein PilX
VEKDILRNKNGVALVIALIMLLILTFIGISAISTTTFETNITGNERVGTDAFYASEAVFQIGLRQLDAPDSTNKIKPIPRTNIGEDSYGWSGGPKDKGSPKNLLSFGLYPKTGYDSSWAFNRYQINATGESFGAMKEVEAQVSYGPFPGGTQY